MIIHRPGQKILTFSDDIQIVQPRVSAAVDRWLTGGIPAANCTAAYEPKGAASLAVSYSNLNDPGTNNAAPGVAPTWNGTDGWILNGSTQYLVTGVQPGITSSAICRYSSVSAAAEGVLFGCDDADNDFFMINFTASTNTTKYQHRTSPEGVLAAVPILTSGVLAVTPTNGYRDGVSDGLVLGLDDAVGEDIYLGCRNNDGVAAGFLGVKIQAFYVYDIPIDPYVAGLTTAMAAL